MRSHRRLTLPIAYRLSVACMLVAACNGNGPATPQSVDLTGRYEGPLTFTTPLRLEGSVVASLEQNGTSLKGSYSTISRSFPADTGILAGTISDALVSLHTTSATGARPCDFNGTVLDAGDRISGTFTCGDSAGAFTLNRCGGSAGPCVLGEAQIRGVGRAAPARPS